MVGRMKKVKAIVKFGEWGQDGSGQEYGSANCLGWFLELTEQEFGDGDNTVSLVEEQTNTSLLK